MHRFGRSCSLLPVVIRFWLHNGTTWAWLLRLAVETTATCWIRSATSAGCIGQYLMFAFLYLSLFVDISIRDGWKAWIAIARIFECYRLIIHGVWRNANFSETKKKNDSELTCQHVTEQCDKSLTLSWICLKVNCLHHRLAAPLSLYSNLIVRSHCDYCYVDRIVWGELFVLAEIHCSENVTMSASSNPDFGCTMAFSNGFSHSTKRKPKLKSSLSWLLK